MLMVSTFIGPGAIFLVLAGALNTVFLIDIWTSILYNAIPVVLFMITCYFMDSKWQLSFAKLLTVAYVLLMLAVLIGIAIQVLLMKTKNNKKKRILTLFLPTFFMEYC